MDFYERVRKYEKNARKANWKPDPEASKIFAKGHVDPGNHPIIQGVPLGSAPLPIALLMQASMKRGE